MPEPTDPIAPLTAPLKLRAPTLDAGTPCFLYEARELGDAANPNANPPELPTDPHRSNITGSSAPVGDHVAEWIKTKPGWKVVQVGNALSDPFLWTPALAARGALEVAIVDGRVMVRVPGTEPAPHPSPEPAPGLDRHFTAGSFVASISAYGLAGAPLDRVERDLSRLASSCGFANARVFIDWPSTRAPGCSMLDSQGNWINAVADSFEHVLDFAASVGMSLDLTMRAANYEAVKTSNEGYDITTHKRAVRRVLERWGTHPAVRILDMANEAEVRGAGGHGSPDTGHVSPKRFAELMAVARSVPHSCLVSCSVSGGGDFGNTIDNYLCEKDGKIAGLFRDARGEILLPHFGRSSGWGSKEGANASALRKRVPGLLVHHQEPARRHYPGPNDALWPIDEFRASFLTARESGSVGCCFHTGAGFNMNERDLWEQLDDVERKVCAEVASWIA